VQACILHLIRSTFRHASKRDWDALARDLKPIYTAVNETDAAARFEEFTETWGQEYPAIIALLRTSWREFIPFLDYDVENRRIICSTNAIESLNARYRRAIRARGHSPTEQAELKCRFLIMLIGLLPAPGSRIEALRRGMADRLRSEAARPDRSWTQ
jgi:putative transposase